jgi:hypothetical protein
MYVLEKYVYSVTNVLIVAEHVVTGAKVAVKIVNRRKMMEQSMWPRIKREISLMQARFTLLD